LIFTLWRVWLGKFDVELAIAERIFGMEFAGLGEDFKVAVFDFPFGGATVFLRPFGKVFAVEEDDSVGGSFAGPLLRAGGAGLDYGGDWAIAIVDFPFRIDLGGADGGGGENEEWEKQEFFHRSVLAVTCGF
jgi:hypothetical protein